MKHSRAVLFDLGYTLLDYSLESTWREFLPARLEEIHPLVRAEAEGVPISADEFASAAARMIGGERAREIEQSGRSCHFADRLRAALAAAGASCDDDALGRLTAAFCEPIRAASSLYAETEETLEALCDAGTRLAIVSNTYWDVPGRFVRGDMERWEIDGYFQAMIFSGDVPWRKPNPEFMLAAARELDVEPEECLVVGDSLKADIAGARAAGMRSVWINREGVPLSAGEPRPDWIITTLVEVQKIATEGTI